MNINSYSLIFQGMWDSSIDMKISYNKWFQMFLSLIYFIAENKCNYICEKEIGIHQNLQVFYQWWITGNNISGTKEEEKIKRENKVKNKYEPKWSSTTWCCDKDLLVGYQMLGVNPYAERNYKIKIFHFAKKMKKEINWNQLRKNFLHIWWLAGFGASSIKRIVGHIPGKNMYTFCKSIHISIKANS